MERPKIYNYLDYRKFLQDYFNFLKANRKATYRSLGKKAGFTSPNFLKLVMKGERHLSEKKLKSTAEALGLNTKELKFFENLAKFNQAKSLDKKDKYYNQLRLLRRNLPIQHLEHHQLQYYDRWYAVATREMVGLEDFQEDPAWISKKLIGDVSPAKVKKALELLEELELLERGKDGLPKSSQKTITAQEKLGSLSLFRFHKSMLQLAIKALEEKPSNHRSISGVTFGVGQKEFEKIKEKIFQFREEILSIAKSSKNAEAVYQFNLQLFNLSEVPW